MYICVYVFRYVCMYAYMHICISVYAAPRFQCAGVTCTVTWKVPAAASMVPGREATVPESLVTHTCIPKMASASPSAPCSAIFLPPAPPSSAGWKMRRTLP